jgi:hypothetical protein
MRGVWAFPVGAFAVIAAVSCEIGDTSGNANRDGGASVGAVRANVGDDSVRRLRPLPFQYASDVWVGDGAQATSLAIGDANGDGKLDIFVTTILILNPNDAPRGQLLVLYGRGDGTFGDAKATWLDNPMLSGVTTDADGDGLLDVVLQLDTQPGSPGALENVVLRGNGTGVFTPLAPVGESSPAMGMISPLVTGDFDEDGIADLIFSKGNFPGEVDIRLAANGSFANERVTRLGDDPYFDGGFPTQATCPAVGHFDRDAHLDAACIISSGAPYPGVALGRGDGALASGWSAPAKVGVASLDVADFDGDGLDDIVTLIKTPNGSPQGGAAAWDYGVEIFSPGNPIATLPPRMSTLPASSVLAADFDGDGKKDIAVLGPSVEDSRQTPTMQIFRGRGNGTFFAPDTFPLPNFTSQGQGKLADLNGDGLPDIVAIDDPFRVIVVLSDSR